jgi:predicted AAA+ superfamily ATPase
VIQLSRNHLDNESAADNVGVRGAVRRLRRGRNTQESRQSRDAQGAYYFRDQQGLEVDFLVPRPNAGLWLVEAKATQTVRPAMASSLLSLGAIVDQAVGSVSGGSPEV